VASEELVPRELEDKLTASFLAFCKAHGDTPFSVAADYHGSLIWQLLWDDLLERSLVLAATPEGNKEADIGIELDIAAGDAREYKTERVVDWVMRSGRLEFRSPTPLDKERIAEFGIGAPPFEKELHLAALQEVLSDALVKAYDRASEITVKDLDRPRLLPVE